MAPRPKRKWMNSELLRYLKMDYPGHQQCIRVSGETVIVGHGGPEYRRLLEDGYTLRPVFNTDGEIKEVVVLTHTCRYADKAYGTPAYVPRGWVEERDKDRLRDYDVSDKSRRRMWAGPDQAKLTFSGGSWNLYTRKDLYKLATQTNPHDPPFFEAMELAGRDAA